MLGMISCKEATYLTSKLEEGKLSFSEKVKLKLHFALCSVCKIFSLQNKYIAKHAKHIEKTQMDDNDVKLPGDKRDQIEDAIS